MNNGGTDTLPRPSLGPDGRIVLGGIPKNDVLMQTLIGAQYADFAGAWAAAGSRFAGCLETLSAGTPGWGVAGTNNCVIGSPANWRAISATSGDSTALVASTVTGNATAALRFGIEGDGAQAKGNYVAPIEFEVLAPG